MANLNHPAIEPGMLSAADLEDARRNNPGSIWQISPHRMLPGRDTCNGSCQSASGCECHAAYCAPEGGKHREPSAALQSMRRHDRIRYRAGLALLLAVAGYLSHLAWPLLGA